MGSPLLAMACSASLRRWVKHLQCQQRWNTSPPRDPQWMHRSSAWYAALCASLLVQMAPAQTARNMALWLSASLWAALKVAPGSMRPGASQADLLMGTCCKACSEWHSEINLRTAFQGSCTRETGMRPTLYNHNSPSSQTSMLTKDLARRPKGPPALDSPVDRTAVGSSATKPLGRMRTWSGSAMRPGVAVPCTEECVHCKCRACYCDCTTCVYTSCNASGQWPGQGQG